MGFLWFGSKKYDEKIEEIHKILENSFSKVKKDINVVGKWINHFESKIVNQDDKIEDFKRRIEVLEENISSLGLFRGAVQTPVRFKQLSVRVQTPVQTAVQTPSRNILEKNLRSLTVMERAVVWVLLNTDLKMSYDDLTVTLGKDKSTLRGQINNIKRKSEGLINEVIENSGQKRFYIDEKVKNQLLKGIKTSQNRLKKAKK